MNTIMFSRAAAKTLVELIDAGQTQAAFTIEDTNIDNTIALKTRRGITLIHHNGEFWHLGGVGAVASPKTRMDAKPPRTPTAKKLEQDMKKARSGRK